MKQIARHKAILWFFFFLLFACQKFPDQSLIKDGRRYGTIDIPFKGSWWHYYERALSFADGEFWQEAESDLREALDRREKDQQNARTYGRHWLNLPNHDPGYFPHRELGIVLFQEGRTSEAIRELEQSFESEKSSRAALYLDRARKALIQQRQSDASPPKISILSPEPNSLSNASSVLIRGEVTDDTFVRHIRVGNQNIRTDVSAQQLSFSAKVPVQAGRNQISVLAKDLAGRKTETIIIVHVDRIGPVISLENFFVSKQKRETEVYIRGNLFDNSGIRAVSVNGEELLYSGESELFLEKRIRILSENKTIHISATDSAGNRTSADYSLSDVSESALNNTLLAENGNGLAKKLLTQRSEQRRKRVWLTLQMDHTPPWLRLTRLDDNKTHETYLDEILIQGQITDDREVRGLWFNREHIAFRGRDNHFSYIYPLKKGPNIILIRGSDEAGNEVRREIRVLKKEPSVREYKARLRVLIDDFIETPVLKTGFHDLLDTIMFDRKRFQAVTIAEVTNSPADCTLEGNIRKRLHYMEISANLYVNSSASNPVRIAKVDAYREWGNENELTADRETLWELAREIHLKLADEVPLTEGKIIERNSQKTIATDLGEDSRIKEGMELIVFQKNSDYPYKDFSHTGTARIDNVLKEKSYAAIEKGDQQSIREGQYVITR